MNHEIKDHIGDVTLDVTGHKCPIPVLRLRKFMERLKKGDELTLKATDPMTELDIPHFCTQAGHILIRQWQERPKKQPRKEDLFFFLIKKDQE